jgi:hypothetical protein
LTGYYGKDNVEAVKCDMMAGSVEDLKEKWSALAYATSYNVTNEMVGILTIFRRNRKRSISIRISKLPLDTGKIG